MNLTIKENKVNAVQQFDLYDGDEIICGVYAKSVIASNDKSTRTLEKQPEAKKNLDFIVTACGAHKNLVAVAKTALSVIRQARKEYGFRSPLTEEELEDVLESVGELTRASQPVGIVTGVIVSNHPIIRIAQFMALPDSEKVKYWQMTYPTGRAKPSDAIEYGIGVYQNRQCESCEDATVHAKAFGTDDSREPKFCEKHFIEISEETDFYIPADDLSEFDPKKLDLLERKIYDDMKNRGRTDDEIVNILINNVEGDYSQLGDHLLSIAKKRPS